MPTPSVVPGISKRVDRQPPARPARSAFVEQELKARGAAEVIVVLKRGAATGVAAADGAGRRAAVAAAGPNAAVYAQLAQHFKLTETSQTAALLQQRAVATGARMSLRAQEAARPVRTFANLGVMLGTVTPEGLSAIETNPAVQSVTGAPQIRLIRPRRIAAARLTETQTWGIRKLEIPALWRRGLDGSGVLVGHLDTGVDGRHPALRPAISAFAQFDDLGFIVPNATPFDSDDHGTHTAGTIAGRPVRGKAIGVAPGATLASGLVIEGGDVVARVLAGMDWVVGEGARVISMSLGFPGFWEDFLPITVALRENGVLPVMATGNEGPGTSRSPGNYSEALSVGAIANDGTVASFSSSQRFIRDVDAIVPDVVAPGVDVISAKPRRGYQTMDGTSMATPHIAGLAAILFQAFPNATLDQVEEAIFVSSARTPQMRQDRVNRGLPNGPRAFAHLQQLNP